MATDSTGRPLRASAFVCVAAVAALAAGCSITDSDEPRAGATEPDPTKAHTGKTANAATVAKASTILDKALHEFATDGVYPQTTQLDTERSTLTLRAKTTDSATTQTVQDAALDNGVTLGWYRNYPDDRLGRPGAGDAAGKYFSYCLSGGTNHKVVSGSGSSAYVTLRDGDCPKAPAKP